MIRKQPSPELIAYLQTGSEERLNKLKTKLDITKEKIRSEEETMSVIAEAFLQSSERHARLSNTQRSLMAMIHNHEKEMKHE